MKVEIDPKALLASDEVQQAFRDIEANVSSQTKRDFSDMEERLKGEFPDVMNGAMQELILGSAFIKAFADLLVGKASKAGVTLPALKATVARRLKGCLSTRAIHTYCRPGQQKMEGKRPLMFVGDKGSGKTHVAYHVGVDLYEESNVHLVDCHADIMPESLYGHPCAEGDGTPALGWRDGVVTTAFRRMKATKKPQLIIFDEFLQLPSSSLNALKSLLGGLGEEYVCTTGKPTGKVGKARGVEKLRCGMENIGFIMTSNIGGRYEVRELDDAMKSRIKIFHMDCKVTDIKRVLKPIIEQRQDAYGWSDEASKWLMTALCSVHTDTKRFANTHELETYAGTRELMGVLTQLEHPAEILNIFDERSVLCERPYFVAVDDFGKPNPDQKRKFLDIGASMKAKAKAFQTEDARSDDDKEKFDALLRHVIME